MTVLITGGTGKTGRRLASLLMTQGIEHRVATRYPHGGKHLVGFDWQREETWREALKGINALYLVAPQESTAMLLAMRPFLELALRHGVRRFVLLSASTLPCGGPMMGAVHQWLKENTPEWAALRPTWFMQNFSEQQHAATLISSSEIYSATDQGKIPFIDAEDIAAVAAKALLGPALNRDAILTGPELLSYDDIAQQLTCVLNKPVRHVNLSEALLAHRFIDAGMPQEYAQTLAAMDTAIAKGAEARLTDEVERITGRAPQRFADFARRNRHVWQPVKV